MLGRFLPVTALLLAVTHTCRAQVDATTQAGTFGPDVVDAVVNVIKAACILSDDRQFLRRLAYVESLDGMAIDTYRADYHGGIWQVNQDMFEATRPCLGYLVAPCLSIRQKFNIDWTRVTWSDLRKPLYSGLAAALYLLQRAGSNTNFIPPDLSGQGQLWSQYYHFGNPPANNFTSLASRVNQFSCKDNIDLAFILDGSGSIDPTDFNLSLNFVAAVVTAMNVTQLVRVAAVKFDTTPQVEFYFNTHSNKETLVTAIRNIRQVGGSTGTNMALDLTRTSVFSSLHGARPTTSTKRVAILVTDGQSDNTLATAQAARRLREESAVTVFSIGVGGYDLAELKSVASDPVCTHVYTLSTFSYIQNIIQEIERSVCTAQKTVNLGSGGISSTEPGTTHVTAPVRENITTVVTVNCGIVEVYISYTNPNPNSAMYTEKYTASDDHPAYLSTSEMYSGQHVCMTVVGSRLPPTAEGLRNCSDFHYQVSVVERTTQIMCCNEGHCHVCSDSELKQDHRIRQVVCSSPEEFRNPCTKEAMDSGYYIFPYPYDTSKFIRCDYKGNAYVTLCPNRETFNPITRTCGFETPGSSMVRPLPEGYPNPCTPANIQAQRLFHPYTPDLTMYIHCDLWGHAFLEQCPEQSVWSQSSLACVLDTPHQPGTQAPVSRPPFVNPCTPEAIATGHLYFPYPCDHTRFIHCDITGNYYIQFCPGGMFYHPDAYICVVGDPQEGSQHGCD